MKSFVRPIVLAVLVSAAVLVLPSSAQARHYAWDSWSDRAYGVKTRDDMYFTPGTKSAWQFQRGNRHNGKRQVRIIVQNWYVDTNTYGPWNHGPWKKIAPGQKFIYFGPLVFPCAHRDGHGYKVVAQVRKKAHGVWSAPRDLTWSAGSGSLDC